MEIKEYKIALPQRAMLLSEVKSARRADALFKTLSTDFLLREQFVTDPAQLLSEYLGQKVPEESADAANQLVYALLSNRHLRDWLLGYARQLRGKTPSHHEFALAFAKANAAHGDELTTLALIRGSADTKDHFAVQSTVLRALISVLGGRFGAGGTEMSPGGTEMSPGTATDMSPGGVFSTEMSPGGTEMSPGTATDMSPGGVFSTDMSPGTATDKSPGTATDMSPGHLGGWQIAEHLRITLVALVQYAGQLRSRGALHLSGLEGR